MVKGAVAIGTGARIAALVLGLALWLAAAPGLAQSPAGEVTVSFHVTLAPSWFDPSAAPPQITPFGVLYAIHDALVRPLPGQKMGPSLAESWTESPDGLVYEFKLRRGLKFHNGDPVTADDAKWSFERYQGAGARQLQSRVRLVEAVDPLTLRIHLKEPWPDFMTFYGTTAAAVGIVLPRKYYESVGSDAFRQRPVGAGPYKFVSQRPGVDVVLEAFPGYWRHAPYVKRLVMKGVPDSTTRLAMLKSGETDYALFLDGPEAEAVKRDPRVTLVATRHASIFWIEFADQWDPKSPWADKRLRLAVNYALDRKTTNEAACLGFCPPAGVIVPRAMDFALQAPALPYDPQKSKQLLAEAGYPNGLDAGDFVPSPAFPAWPTPRSTASTRWGSACACGPWSARPSIQPGRRRSSGGSSWWRWGTRAMRRAASSRSSTRRAATLTAAIPISTRCSCSRRGNAIPPSAR